MAKKVCKEESKQKEKKKREKIVTHDNTFHLDDVLACFMLKVIRPRSKIVRTRDPVIISKGDYVVDVGGVYDSEKRRFDHHQRGFNTPYNSDISSIPMSSAGMVFKHFGEEFIRKISASAGINITDEEQMKSILDRVYYEYFLTVDAQDNGVEISDNSRYTARNIGDIVKEYNPYAFPKDIETSEEKAAYRKKKFVRAMKVMGRDLVRLCRRLVGEQKRMHFVFSNDNIETFGSVDKGQYIHFYNSSANAAMIKHRNKIEKQRVLVYIANKMDEGVHKFTINCISKENANFTTEAPLPEKWRGRREDTFASDAELQIRDCLFVHATGFFGIAKTLECAKYMAECALEEYRKKLN